MLGLSLSIEGARSTDFVSFQMPPSTMITISPTETPNLHHRGTRFYVHQSNELDLYHRHVDDPLEEELILKKDPWNQVLFEVKIAWEEIH